MSNILYGVGVDLLNSRRIDQISSKEYFYRFCNRILSIYERESCAAIIESDRRNIFIAKRFSAKEAIMKALGTGYRLGIAFNDIDISKNSLGKPEVKLLNNTNIVVQKLINNNFNIEVSWSDDQGYILAFAVVELTALSK